MTRRQLQCLNFIKRFELKNDRAPTYREIKDGIGLKSTSGIHRLVHALEERGEITTKYHVNERWIRSLTAFKHLPNFKYMAWPHDRG